MNKTGFLILIPSIGRVPLEIISLLRKYFSHFTGSLYQCIKV